MQREAVGTPHLSHNQMLQVYTVWASAVILVFLYSSTVYRDCRCMHMFFVSLRMISVGKVVGKQTFINPEINADFAIKYQKPFFSI